MGKNIVFVAPHPDDETLGCGGTALKHIANGDNVYWLIVTHVHAGMGSSEARIKERDDEISQVEKAYGFKKTYNLKLPAIALDTLPVSDIVGKMSAVFKEIEPHTVYLPHPGDVHSDHRVVFDAGASCTKWFRYPSVKRVLTYETISETEQGISPDENGFRPNLFVDISPFLSKKIEIMKSYKSEMADFPFPRSEKGLRSLAEFRGATCGVDAAEAFMVLREIQN